MYNKLFFKIVVATIVALTTCGGGVVNTAEAHHVSKNRAKCRWYSSKHTAEVRIHTALVPICIDREIGCNWIDYSTAAHCDRPCGWGKTWSNGTEGAIRQNICSRGFSDSKISDYFVRRQAQFASASSSPIAQDKVEWDTISYDYTNRKVDLTNLRGYLHQKSGQYMEHYVEVILWIPQDDTIDGIVDTTVTTAKTAWRGKLTFYDGTPTWSGDWTAFPNNRYSVTNNSTIKRMQFDSLDMQISVPTGVNMDDLELMVIVHSGINETTFAEAQLEESNDREGQDQVQINVFPNPASPLNDVNLTVLVPANNSLTIRLFNGNGSFHSTLFTGTVEVGTLHNTTIPSGTLNTGTYFATFEVGNEVYIKRFLIQ